MEEYYYSYYKKNHVPEFGSWDWNDKVPFTECFETVKKNDSDLYVTGDLYDHHVVTHAAMIVVPPKKAKVHKNETKRKKWVNNVDSKPSSPIPLPRPTPKPIDEDLYKISPDFLYAKVKKRKGLCFFCSCLLPTCIA